MLRYCALSDRSVSRRLSRPACRDLQQANRRPRKLRLSREPAVRQYECLRPSSKFCKLTECRLCRRIHIKNVSVSMLSHSDIRKIQSLANKPLLSQLPGRCVFYLNTSLRCIRCVCSLQNSSSLKTQRLRRQRA